MAKKAKDLEARLDYLGALSLSSDELTEDDLAIISKELNSKKGLLISKAVEIIVDRDLRQFSEQLIETLKQLFDASHESDPGCESKCKIVNLLIDWQKIDLETLFIGVRYQQLEPVWGRSIDTAGRLRGVSARGLILKNHSRAGFEIARLMADDSVEARLEAIEASTYLPTREWEMLVRHKIYAGKDEPEIILACFDVLSRYAPENSMDLFEEMLHRDGMLQEDGIFREGAALALGTSRQPQAFELLKTEIEKTRFQSDQRILVQGMALLRSEESFQYLVNQIKECDQSMLGTIQQALEIWDGFEEKEEQIREAFSSRKV